MGDIQHASQEVEITDQTTGSRIVPNADGSMPIAPVGVTGVRVNPATEDTLTPIRNAVGLVGQPSPANGILSSGMDAAGNLVANRFGNVGRTPGQFVVSFPAPAYATYQGRMFGWAGNMTVTVKDVEQAILYLLNPAVSGYNMVVHNLDAFIYAETAKGLVAVYHSPTVTDNGTLQTAHNRFVGNVATPVTQLYSLPTVTANGTATSRYSVGANSNSQRVLIDGSLIVAPGNSLLITAKATTNATIISGSIMWGEMAI